MSETGRRKRDKERKRERKKKRERERERDYLCGVCTIDCDAHNLVFHSLDVATDLQRKREEEREKRKK